MDDKEFIIQAATLLAQCSPEQRARLAEQAQNFGKKADTSGAQDARPTPRNRYGFTDPDAGKSLDERFPGLKRLRGY